MKSEKNYGSGWQEFWFHAYLLVLQRQTIREFKSAAFRRWGKELGIIFP